MREAVRKPMQTCGCGSKTSWQSSPPTGTDGSHTSSGDEASWSITSESHVSCGSTHLTPRRVRAWLATTNSKHKQPVYPNLRCSITPVGPDELWVADLTYIRLTTGFVFLAVVLDAWSRRVIGYAISHLLDTRLCLAALDAALDLRRPRAGLVHHSDRGVQYASQAYRSRLAAHRIRGSMSRRGNPYDNAHVESFFKTLKHEEIFANDYSTIDDVADRLPHFLEEVYNRRRLHSSLGYMPPEEFESIHAA